jgi:diguanylate cyclase (GGDEF)-like protein/PAS domain S-box-containing protein
MSIPSKIWILLTEPCVSVRGEETRQKSRFIMTLLVLMAPMGVIITLASGFLTYSTEFTHDNDFFSILGGAVVWGIAYWVARRGRYRLGTSLAAGAGLLAVFLGAVLDADGGTSELSFLVFPILLASVTLTLMQTTIFVATSLLVALLVSLIHPAASFYEVVIGPATYLVVGSFVILLANRYRDSLEFVRRAALKEKEERYRNLIEDGYGGLCVVANQRILDANEGFVSLFGDNLQRVIGTQIQDLVIPEYRQTLARGLADPSTTSIEVLARRRDGSPFYLEMLPSLQEYEGRKANMIAVRDITRQVEMKDEYAQLAKDLARSNTAITALNEISAQISASLDPSEVLESLGKELRKLDLECAVILLEEDGQTCILDYLSIASNKIARAERIIGIPLSRFRMDRSSWVPEMSDVLVHGKSVFITDFRDAICNFFPDGSKRLIKSALSLGNLSSDTSAYYLPLQTEGVLFGSLTIWGEHLRREDHPTFMIFANHVANIYKNARLQKSKEDQSLELKRANTLVNALSRVSLKALAMMEPRAIFEALGEELNRIGLRCSYTSVSEDHDTAVIEYVSVDTKKLSRIEKAANANLTGYTITRSNFSTRSIIAGEEMRPIFVRDFGKEIAPLFTGVGKSILRLGFHIAGISDETPGVFHPLQLHQDRIGFLTVWGDSVRESDLPAYTVFCSQVRSSLEIARLYEVERTQAEDLMRNQELVNALNNVVHKVNMTHDATSVLETLGDELKSLGLDCLVTLVDPDANEGYIEFHSMDLNLIQAAERLTNTKFSEHRIPLERWPGAFVQVFKEGISQYCEAFNSLVAEFIPMSNVIASKALSIVGVTKDTAGILLPLRRDDFVFGCLSIWGEELRERDLQTYTIFSGQIAGAFENARLYETEQAQAAELERSNAVITSLSSIAARITSCISTDDLYEHLGQELWQIGLNCLVSLLDEHGETYKTSFLSHPSELLYRAARITGLKFDGHHLSGDNWVGEALQAVGKDQPNFIRHFGKFVTNFFPKRLRNLGGRIRRLANITDETSAMLLPLIPDQDSLGVIVVWGYDLNENDLHAFQIFAGEVAALMETTRLRESELLHAAELERSNAVVKALSTVSSRISSTNNPDEVISTLGEEFKRLGMDCLVTLLEPGRQAGYIHYISFSPDILEQVEKLTGVVLSRYRFPRSVWPQASIQVLDHAETVFLDDFSESILSYFPKIASPIMRRGLDYLGVSNLTSAFYLPLAIEGVTFGALTIWGDSLRNDDLAAYSVFAGQVANVFESAQLFNQAEGEIARRQEIQEHLECSRKELRGLFENAHDAILVIEPEVERILDVNERACEVYGYTKSEFIGMDLSSISKEVERTRDHIAKTMETGTYHHFETVHARKDGQKMDLEINASVVEYQGKPAIQSINRDVTARKRYQRKLEYDAVHDGLTDLPNRELFQNRLEHAIARLGRHKDVHFAVLYIDLDQFKRINDSLGHSFGDRLLIEIGRRLQEAIRETDIVARLGGDEFVILLDDMSSTEAAARFCDRLMHCLSEPMRIENHEFVITASAGIVMSSPRYHSPADYLRDADTAMYKAKRLGKQRFVVYDESMHAEVYKKLNMESHMRNGLKNQEFFLEYQPIICLKTSQVIGHEALIRWRSSEQGLLPPMDFIPVAEESGIIHEIGAWVLTEACNQFQSWIETNPPIRSQTISVNVSSIQLLHPRFPDVVKEVLQKTGLSPELLCLEITETALITETAIVESALQAIHDTGVNIHLDDFGTGYSSLGFLARFPIDAIKIDRRFVIDLGEGNNSGLVKSMISMGHELGLHVIAEGVESTSQRDRLKAMNCENAQGYLFSKPVPAEKIKHVSFELV